ncbi:MAG TPA: Zn-dependent hydrolase [Chloroflexia bacterium]|nr:Zn-dependent hydrolase [Chloroflexia bacterium]
MEENNPIGELLNLKKCDPARIGVQIEELATIRNPAIPGWTRRSFTPEYLKGREYVKARMQEAGLEVRLDAGANMLGRWAGKNSQLPPLMLGSHSDTVQGGGRFDGMAGLLGAIEAVRLLREAGVRLEHPVEVVDFLAEEPSEFGISTVGSRAMVGNLQPEMLEATDPAGRTLRRGISEVGGDPERMNSEVRRPGSVAGYIEMHIEQGRKLYDAAIPLGVVTRIAGIRRYAVTVEGETDHAGATEMSRRRDALTASCEIILALEALARQRESRNVVATVGRLNVEPNSPNVVPGRTNFTAEMRSIWPEELVAIAEQFSKEAEEKATARNVAAILKMLSSGDPVVIPDPMQALIEEACHASGHSYMRLPSGAGHDTNQLARIAPVGMLFIPSINGKSHCPEEETALEDVAAGVDTLVQALLLMDSQLDRLL